MKSKNEDGWLWCGNGSGGEGKDGREMKKENRRKEKMRWSKRVKGDGATANGGYRLVGQRLDMVVGHGEKKKERKKENKRRECV